MAGFIIPITILIVATIGIFFGRYTFTGTDIFGILTGVTIIIFTYNESPWKKIACLPGVQEFKLHNPNVDLSSPVALARSVAIGGGTFAVASAANATGFGVFMASAQVLGAMGMSFTGVHLSMSALGFLLNPIVFTSVSITAGVIAFATSVKTGNKLLDDATTALQTNDWNNAYQNAKQASNKSLLKPNRDKILAWKQKLDSMMEARQNELVKLKCQCDELAVAPEQRQRSASVKGFFISLPAAFLIVLMDGSCWSAGLIIIAITLLIAERSLSVPMFSALSRLPVLYAEINALELISGINF